MRQSSLYECWQLVKDSTRSIKADPIKRLVQTVFISMRHKMEDSSIPRIATGDMASKELDRLHPRAEFVDCKILVNLGILSCDADLDLSQLTETIIDFGRTNACSMQRAGLISRVSRTAGLSHVFHQQLTSGVNLICSICIVA